MMDRHQLETALETFVEGCRRIHTEPMEKYYPNGMPDVFTTQHGKRYIKIVRTGLFEQSGDVHCFVDMTNGDVLKATGWELPAKHARGNIFDEHNGLGKMGEYGPA